MRMMSYRATGIAIGVLLALSPAVFAQPIDILNAQLQQAISSSRWSRAVQILNQMLAARPEQAARLKVYRQQLQRRLNDVQGRPEGISAPRKSAISARVDDGTVTVINALVSRREFRERVFINPNRLTLPLVKYSLKMEIYNGTRGIAKQVHVYYDILSWNEDYNESGSIVISDIQSNRKAYFEDLLQRRAVPPDSKNRYEGVRVRINRVEWFNEDGSAHANGTPVQFGYWGKV
jgi:hypothetical protein